MLVFREEDEHQKKILAMISSWIDWFEEKKMLEKVNDEIEKGKYLHSERFTIGFERWRWEMRGDVRKVNKENVK